MKNYAAVIQYNQTNLLSFMINLSLQTPMLIFYYGDILSVNFIVLLLLLKGKAFPLQAYGIHKVLGS
jgi:hypothetical protein